MIRISIASKKSSVLQTAQSVVLFAVLACSFQPLYAWGDLGHETVGEIASRHMKPKTKHFVDYYLKQNLAMAAVAPDKVKSDPFFTGKKAFNSYHYVNFEGLDENGQVRLTKKDRSAFVLLDSAFKILSGRDGGVFDDYQKKLMLQYVIHVVGDLQQPLHVGYAHDKGANACSVKYIHPYYKKEIATNLHSIWDTDILENYARVEFYNSNPSYKWFGYVELADMLEAETKKMTQTANLSLDVNDWLKESATYHGRAYPAVASGSQFHKRLAGGHKVHAYCSYKLASEDGKTKRISAIEEAVPTLGAEFAKASLSIIKRQLALGGLRLAAYLDAVAKNACEKQPELCGVPHRDQRRSSIHRLWDYLKG